MIDERIAELERQKQQAINQILMNSPIYQNIVGRIDELKKIQVEQNTIKVGEKKQDEKEE